MDVLFIGGTGNISASVSRLAVERGIRLSLLNRGERGPGIPGAASIRCDIAAGGAAQALEGRAWDAVVDWIAFRPGDIERDFRLFGGKTKQYIFISSASVYRKPLSGPVITEASPLANPYWQYSRDKIACEEALLRHFREDGFPATIVRPSHTYDTIIPLPFGGGTEYTVVDRMKRGKKVIVHGDGTSLWTVTHAGDFARGFVSLLGNPRAIGEAFHITSDESLTWDQIHRAVAEAAGCAADIVHVPSDVLVSLNPELRGPLLGDKSASVIFDNAKIRGIVTDFSAAIPFREGIRRTIAWFEAVPGRQIVREETNRFIDDVIRRIGNAFGDREPAPSAHAVIDKTTSMRPIGRVRSPYTETSQVPKGCGAHHEARGVLEVFPEFGRGLTDIEGFSHLYVIWVFDRIEGYDLFAIPPTDDRPHGVFSTRSPRRPNPIGLTVVRLIGREGDRLTVEGVDMLDGTPILDIKPYLSGVNPDDLKRGWLAEAEQKHRGSGAEDRGGPSSGPA